MRLDVRGVSMFVDVRGHGRPLALMHGGPGADHWSLARFGELARDFTCVFYDHRCNGRSTGAPVTTMTWDNLTADADALRERLGFERWAVLGHSFGGHVALEYALRYPERVTHLVLIDTAGDGRWARENAAKVVLSRGHGTQKAELVRRWFNGELQPREMLTMLIKIGDEYASRPSLAATLRDMVRGEWRTKLRPEAFIFAGRHLLRSWSVMDRLSGITAPTLIVGGRDDFIFPPEHQAELAAGIPNARLEIIEHAGHNPQSEQPAEVMRLVRDFIIGSSAPTRESLGSSSGSATSHPDMSRPTATSIPTRRGL